MSGRGESRAHSLLFKAQGLVGTGSSERPIRVTAFAQSSAELPVAVLRIGSGAGATERRGRLHGFNEGAATLALSCVVATARADGEPVYADVLRMHMQDGKLVGDLLPARIAALVSVLRDPQRAGVSKAEANDAVEVLMRSHAEGVGMTVRFMAPGAATRSTVGASAGSHSGGGLRHG